MHATMHGKTVAPALSLAALLTVLPGSAAHAQPKKPNILVIWGDDISRTTSAPPTWGTTVTIGLRKETCDEVHTGYLKVSGDEMKGELDGMNPANVVLKRQK